MFASTPVTISDTELKPIAKDVIAVVVNPNLPVQSLTKKNLADIITGKVTDWKDIPNANVTKSIPITVYYREDGGTTKFITEVLPIQTKDNAFKGKNFISLKDKNSPLDEAKNKVKNDEGAIYFVTASESVYQCEFKPVPIINDEKKAVAPYEGQLTPRDANCAKGNRNKVNIQAIKDGSYPLTRSIYLVLRNDKPAKQWGEFYLKVLQTDEGKKLIKEAGFAVEQNGS
jgi:phosphate transport system substrate-binding protein